MSDTNDNYWDCECKTNYIHAKSKGNYCPNCDFFSDECPDSMSDEVTKSYNEINDFAIHKVNIYLET